MSDCAATAGVRIDELGFGWVTPLEHRLAGWFGTARFTDPSDTVISLTN